MRLLLSATHKSSATLLLDFAAAFSRDRIVQTFEKGPGSIDPMWLARASGRPCYSFSHPRSTLVVPWSERFVDYVSEAAAKTGFNPPAFSVLYEANSGGRA